VVGVDVANAVARIDQLEFLSDIIPRTITYRKAVARKEQSLMAPDDGENGSPKARGKRPRSGKEAGRGIDQFFKKGNGVVEDEVVVQDDGMDIDG
jgi:hypothetical protein